MKNKISVIGAFDRYNYGDLLFPYIMKFFKDEYLGAIDCEINFYGLRKYMDKHNSEVINTNALKNLPDDSLVINAGGNTLNAPIESLFGDNIDNIILYKIFNVISSILGEKKVRAILRWGLHTNTNYPYCFSKRKVVYNSVGGEISESMLKDTVSDINFAGTYLSVRDKKTYESVNKIADVKLFPDSAIILSDLWDNSFLEKKIRNKIYNLVKQDEYIVFQISKGIVKNKAILEEIQNYINMLPMKIWLLPIGKANSHGDTSILDQIYKKNIDKCIYDKQVGLYETTYIISHSTGFIGSSLHGNLISFSYGICSILISEKNTKNRNYYETWLRESSCNTYTLSEFLYRDLKFGNYNNEVLLKQKKLVYENFRLMSEYIRENI